MRERLGREPQGLLERDPLGDVRAAPVAAHRERPVERGDHARRRRPCARARAAARSAPSTRPSRPGRTSAGWPRRRPRPACSRTSSAPSPMPRAAAARATATSPSGCTACTPVGEMSTGIEIGWPMHRGREVALRRAGPRCAARSRARRTPRGCPGSSRPRSEPATSALYTDLGSRLRARRCASATVSNQAFAIVISSCGCRCEAAAT